MRLYAYAVAGLVLVAALAWLAHRVKVSYRAESERDQAVSAFALYRRTAEEQAKRDAVQRDKDLRGDQILTARVTALQADNEALRRALARVPKTVEKPDATGVSRLAINPDWMLCGVSAPLGRHPADLAACETRASDGAVPDTLSH